MQVETDQLAKFIFLDNKSEKLVNIEIDGVKNNRDMFMFCTELLYKGIQYLYDHDKSGIDIDGLTDEQFKHIQKRLLLTGIEVVLRCEVLPLQQENPIISMKRVPSKQHMVENPIVLGHCSSTPLDHHHLVISTEKAVYDISFKLVHGSAALEKMKR
jgi:hypothetical protein